MKPSLFLLALPVIAFSVSCEQQKWEDTKMFNQNPKAHGEHAEAEAHPVAAEGEPAPAHH